MFNLYSYNYFDARALVHDIQAESTWIEKRNGPRDAKAFLPLSHSLEVSGEMTMGPDNGNCSQVLTGDPGPHTPTPGRGHLQNQL